jgi:osmotically-inducible protein OsmY
MKGRMKVVVLGLILGVGMAGCSRDRDQRSTDTKTAPDTTVVVNPPASSASTSNSDIENAVKAKFQSDEQLRAANINVDANSDKKEITLSGTVPSQELRNRALELAKSAQAGITVNDKIEVKPAA